MIRYESSKQLNLDGFILPFGGKLNPENRWVKWAKVIPWDDFATIYYRSMNTGRGRPCKDARLMIGALIIKHKMTLSDEETVLQIQENPYLQLFVGLATYKDEQPFAASLFVEIRKRMGKEIFSAFEQLQFLRRNLGHITVLLDYLGCPPFPLNHRKQRQYWIIQHVFDQQTEMHKEKIENT